MDLIDTPCPPPNRRKRLRPPSPSLTLLADHVDQFTTEISAATYGLRPLNSLAIAPKRRRIPLRLTRKIPTENSETKQAATAKTSPDAPEDVPSTSTSKAGLRRMSTRSQTANTSVIEGRDDESGDPSILPSSPAALVSNSSIIQPNLSFSDIDSTSTTIIPNSSPNVSAIALLSAAKAKPETQNGHSRKRRRISELVRRVASAAVAKATLSKPKPVPNPKEPPKPTKRATTLTKPTDKKRPVTTAAKPISQANPNKKPPGSRTRATTNLAANNTTRPALKQVTRGMNPPTRSVNTDSEQLKKQSSNSSIGRLRLQKSSAPKPFSDTEYVKRTNRVSKPSSKPARKSASDYTKLEYPLKPELYDTSWLDSQEGVLTQLANEILGATVVSPAPETDTRQSLAEIYNSAEYCTLLDRLKASILHGVLKPSEDQLDQKSKLGEDLGLRDKFAKIFMETYSPQSLKLAMEVVTGRWMGDHKATERDLQAFFETFFIDIEDDSGSWESYGANSHGTMRLWTETETIGSKAWALHRTIQRSLLLVKLLDHGKTCGLFKEPLFRASSESKSSEVVVSKVILLLLPTLGNPIRSLKNCRYTVSHVQKPTEEFRYTITNIKVDLRSGTRLAKLAELLSPPTLAPSTAQKALAAVTLLPRTKAEKAANVSAVLSYLYATGCLPTNSIKPSDIVDGHREVTLSCLWALVAGKRGLKHLVNWKEIEGETRRLWRKYRLDPSKLVQLSELAANDGDDPSEAVYLSRLDLWVHAIAAPQGISCANAATTFTNGNIVGAIVDEYKPSSDNAAGGDPGIAVSLSLTEKLKAIGCSDAFLNLFKPEGRTGRVVNDNFVIASLAFLASRVLAATAEMRAALRVQRWWRDLIFRRQAADKVRELLEKARAAEAAAIHKREEDAAVAIQRAWRGAVARRVAELTSRLTAVQALARGWIVRQAIDYRFRPGAKREERVKSAIEALRRAKAEEQASDPYALGKPAASEPDGESRVKQSKKAKRRKNTVQESALGGGGGGYDIWQDLAEIEDHDTVE
ncbi:hypothetical protein DRE_02755 [Drechslerella stenobrocha 248]|uniref:Calponin-homology (CH) domain-containing protein n=1 Tax=Drechslerella stenobrocha 248 TaxID=1043628 RepID=W7I6L9_9PEZI|nr:hypothetical protein DRE_02755 [Drechslerella stenobrocha 248]